MTFNIINLKHIFMFYFKEVILFLKVPLDVQSTKKEEKCSETSDSQCML